MMRKLVIAALGSLMLAAVPLAVGQGQGQGNVPPKKEGTTAQKKQQDRQNACNARADNKGMSGKARKDFVNACLKGDPAYGPKK